MKVSKIMLIGMGLPALLIICWLIIRFSPINSFLGQNRITDGLTKNDTPLVTPTNNDNLFKLTSPTSGSTVTSPLTLSGEARGTWFFEGSFPVRLEDVNGNVVTSTIATSSEEWMTEEFIPFLAYLDFSVTTDTQAIIVFQKDNPSDIRANDREVRVPVILKATEKEQMTVKAFFTNTILDPEMTCQKVFAVDRQVAKTTGVARSALEELLKGVNDSEKSKGYFSNLNTGITIKSLRIENKTAYVDFDKKIEEGIGGSCRTSAIRAQIIKTLQQFPTISDVVISVEGRTEDILQP